MAVIVRVEVDDRIETGEVENGVVMTRSGVRIPFDEARLAVPSEPSKIVCVGFNYRDHAAELAWEPPAEPLFFLKPPSALLPHQGAVVYPAYARQLDYEGELAVVIGRRCREVPRERALEVVLGYSILNDMTARDIQKTEKQWVRAKAFDTSAPYGPVIVSGLDPSDLRLVTRVNGEIRQESSTRFLIFDVPTLIEAASAIMTLEPGDVIATGTPAGVGAVQPGDEIAIEVEGIGTLVNRVVSPSC